MGFLTKRTASRIGDNTEQKLLQVQQKSAANPAPPTKPTRRPLPEQELQQLQQLETTLAAASTDTTMIETAVITKVYGPTANIYTDILSVHPKASQQEIREAFFCLRYGIYQQLSEEGGANGPLSQEERKKVEMKMDAISAAFHILSDRNKRKAYDDSLAQTQVGGEQGAVKALSRDPPAKETKESSLTIGQKRSAYRRQMNAEQRRQIDGGLNSRKAPAPVMVGEERQEKEAVPAVKGTSIREQMMGQSAKKISIKTAEEVVGQQDEEDSPTAVEEFESLNKFKNIKIDNAKKSTPEPDEGTYDDDSRTYDDDNTYDDRTYDDDRTYGEESYYTYGETTLGTYDDSTYVSYYDDDTYDDRGKYSPSHKTGDMPEPILKGSGPMSKRDKNKGNRRVTIHSHRGKGESGGEDSCPFPGLDDAFEELSGTYKDFKDTLHQVGSAFLISPDDIDKMSDKIRDARHELRENYEKQFDGGQNEQKKKGVKVPSPKPKKAIRN
jgi:hypothetical protein